VQHVEYNFYSSIALAARCHRAATDERRALLDAIAKNQEQLALWARNNPESYGHKHLLVTAEVARLEGRLPEAAELYDRAITAAGREHFQQDEALASELCGRFYLAQGRRRIAALYLSAAVDAYARWGARAKAQALETELAQATATVDRWAPRRDLGPTHDDSGGAALDLLALFRAAEAVSSEVRLPRMVGKLMEVCLATAGAQRGVLVVEEEGRLFVRAVGAIAEATALQRTPLETSPDVSARVVGEVRRTGEALVLADASTDDELASDPYLAAHAVRSLMALPILHRTEVMGVLYLENDLATHAFTPERVRLMTTLSSQIAIALQNSLLFEQLSQEIEERKRAEGAVRFLAEAGATLAESLEYQFTLKKLTQLAVPILADWCAVHVVEEGVIHWVACAHVDATKQALMETRLAADVGRPLPRHVTEVFQSGDPVLHTKVDRAVVERYVREPEGLALVDTIGAESSMVLPLQAHGRFLGALTLASSAPDRRFDARDLAAAQELARRAALAIDNARLYREATEAIRLRDEFLSIASHELNTPVAALKLLSEGFEDEAPTSPEAFSRLMAIVARQSQRLATLVSDMLDVAQISADKFKLHNEPVDLGALVRETVELMRGNLEQARCRLTIEAQPGLVGHWDRRRLRQVVTALLSNAAKFAGGAEVEITVARDGDRMARLIVEDQGIGIPANRLPHIFGRFERAVSATHYGGLGLGLYIVRAIVEAHAGTVAASSVPGAGARFTIALPLP
jgi:signal transduction histidine kinase